MDIFAPEFKKFVAVALILIMFFGLLADGILLHPKKAQALGDEWANIASYFTDTAKWTWDKITWAYEKAGKAAEWASDKWEQSDKLWVKAVKAAWQILRKKLLDMLVDGTIKWIQGGGQPKFVTDWKEFLKDASNKAGGVFVEHYLGAGFLCQPLRAQLRFALQRDQITFEEQVTCTLEDIGKNINDFYNNFNAGGWKAWAKISESQNNFYGAYLLAMDQKMGLQSAALRASQNEAVASAGFLGDKVCLAGRFKDDPPGLITQIDSKKPEDLADNFTCTKWKTRTPGKILADTTSKAVSLDIDWLISADEFNEYLGAILDAVINRVTKEGLAQMGIGDNYKPQGKPPSIGEIDQGLYTDNLEAQNLTVAAIKELKRLRQNLSTAKDQLQANLDFLEQIKAIQETTLKALGWLMRQEGCHTNNYIDALILKKENWSIEIIDTDTNKILDNFPACSKESDAPVRNIRIEMDKIGEIELTINSPISIELQVCRVAVTKKETLIDSYKSDELEKLHNLLDKSPDNTEPLIRKQYDKVVEAENALRASSVAEDNYYQKNIAYLKINPVDETTGQKEWNMSGYTLDLGAYAAMIPNWKNEINSLTDLASAKNLVAAFVPESEILSSAQILILNKYFPTITDLNSAIDVAKIVRPISSGEDPTAYPTAYKAYEAEISALADNFYNVKQEQDAQKEANQEKIIMDSKLAAAILAISEAIGFLDTEGLSVSSKLEDKNLSQLYREIQDFSTEIADQTGSAESYRGISQKSSTSPAIKCTPEQKDSKNTLVSDLCLAKERLLSIAWTFFHQKPSDETMAAEKGEKIANYFTYTYTGLALEIQNLIPKEWKWDNYSSTDDCPAV